MPFPCRAAVVFKGRFQNGMVMAWQGVVWALHGMCELCKSNGKNTI
jgi:hypothetical protein